MNHTEITTKNFQDLVDKEGIVPHRLVGRPGAARAARSVPSTSGSAGQAPGVTFGKVNTEAEQVARRRVSASGRSRPS